MVGNDTIVYQINTCDRITFDPSLEKFSILLAGKMEEDNLKLLIRYPG